MRRIDWRPRAQDDRDALLEYVMGREASTAPIEALLAAVDRLRQYPELGRPGRTPGTRRLKVARTPYVIIYRVRAETIEVVRVYHTAQEGGG